MWDLNPKTDKLLSTETKLGIRRVGGGGELAFSFLKRAAGGTKTQPYQKLYRNYESLGDDDTLRCLTFGEMGLHLSFTNNGESMSGVTFSFFANKRDRKFLYWDTLCFEERHEDQFTEFSNSFLALKASL